jgi:hypothetical protein
MSSGRAGPDSGHGRIFENTTARPTTFLLLFAVVLPAVVAFGILGRQALFVPYQDDYSSIVAFATRYDRLPTFTSKVLYTATAQTNEYKLGFEHSIVASEMELTHHLNFALLTTLGNLFLLPIGYLLWLTYQDRESDLNRRLLQFLPISFLFFSLTYWENLNWATTDLQNIPIILFSFVSIYLLLPRNLLKPSRARLLLACLAAALAAFSSANGFLLGPVGLLILLPRRAYVRSLLWCASFLPPLAAYLYHYTRPVHPIGKSFYFTRPLFFLGFLGCGAIPFRWPAAVLGMVIVGILGLAVRSRFDRNNPVAFYFVAWVVATASLVAWVRGASSFVIVARYSIYSTLVLIFCYSFLAQHLPNRWPTFTRRRFNMICLAFAVSICFLADLHAYKKLGARRRMVLAGIELYRTNPRVNSPMIDPNLLRGFPQEPAYEKDALTNAIREHIYTLPPKQETR